MRKFVPKTKKAVFAVCDEKTCVWNTCYYKSASTNGCIKYTTVDVCDELQTIEVLTEQGYEGIADFETIRRLQKSMGIYDDEKGYVI